MVNSPEGASHGGAPEVVGERVHLVQRGPEAEAAQEVLRVQLVEVKGQLGDPVPLRLPEARQDLKSTKKNLDQPAETLNPLNTDVVFVLHEDTKLRAPPHHPITPSPHHPITPSPQLTRESAAILW